MSRTLCPVVFDTAKQIVIKLEKRWATPAFCYFLLQVQRRGMVVCVKKTLRGLSPRANYTDRAAAAGRRS